MSDPTSIDAAAMVTWAAGLVGVSLSQASSTYVTLLGAAAIGAAFAVASAPRDESARHPAVKVSLALLDIVMRVALALIASSAIVSLIPGDPRVVTAPVAALVGFKGMYVVDALIALVWPRMGGRGKGDQS